MLNHPFAQHHPRIDPLPTPYPVLRVVYAVGTTALVIAACAVLVLLP